jgi:hypothetical protein
MEEHGLMVFENGVLRISGGWRKLSDEEPHNLYISPNIIQVIKSRSMRWGGACSTDGRDE